MSHTPVTKMATVKATEQSPVEAQKVYVEVFGFLDCIYGTKASHLGLLTGSTASHARVEINGVIPLVTGAFCPETTKWVANYTVTTPTGLNVRQ